MSSSTPKSKKSQSRSKARAEPVPSSSSTRKMKSTASSSDRKIPNKVPTTNDNTLFRVNFEVRGKVQGVCLKNLIVREKHCHELLVMYFIFSFAWHVTFKGVHFRKVKNYAE